MSSIYLIRHEQPEMFGRFIGRTDSPLTAAGREAAATKLASVQVAALYVSPLQRARQTAAAISCGVEPIVIPELAEIDLGEWEGLTWQEVEQRWPDIACRKVADWFDVAIPGGECWSAFRDRVDRALQQVLAGPKPAAIVAHMVVNSMLAFRLRGTDPKQFHQHYGEILVCDLPAQHP
jgi:broad specificity phosphatase PhoE